ncbi:MAG TPA: sugar nucleotide-binding protein, partial [Burkholderiaceae bacterium]|nr:sugar nucleotide-binding protein [Burkholderiaceae bacterium]
LIYISTTGVYGNCNGALVEETHVVNPVSARAKRRLDAEQVLRAWARRTGARLGILRVPGIYAENRLPTERLKQGTPALVQEQDVFTNHIHADDLARIIAAALFRALPCRVYHATDDSCMKMGDYFDVVADTFRLPRPPRLPREEIETSVSPALLSFMVESRRISNRRMKSEWRLRLHYPQVSDALRSMTQK